MKPEDERKQIDNEPGLEKEKQNQEQSEIIFNLKEEILCLKEENITLKLENSKLKNKSEEQSTKVSIFIIILLNFHVESGMVSRQRKTQKRNKNFEFSNFKIQI